MCQKGYRGFDAEGACKGAARSRILPSPLNTGYEDDGRCLKVPIAPENMGRSDPSNGPSSAPTDELTVQTGDSKCPVDEPRSGKQNAKRIEDDSRLGEVTKAWSDLPVHIKTAIMILIRSIPSQHE